MQWGLKFLWNCIWNFVLPCFQNKVSFLKGDFNLKSQLHWSYNFVKINENFKILLSDWLPFKTGLTFMHWYDLGKLNNQGYKHKLSWKQVMQLHKTLILFCFLRIFLHTLSIDLVIPFPTHFRHICSHWLSWWK